MNTATVKQKDQHKKMYTPKPKAPTRTQPAGMSQENAGAVRKLVQTALDELKLPGAVPSKIIEQAIRAGIELGKK